jgi:hypothetical protein
MNHSIIFVPSSRILWLGTCNSDGEVRQTRRQQAISQKLAAWKTNKNLKISEDESVVYSLLVWFLTALVRVLVQYNRIQQFTFYKRRHCHLHAYCGTVSPATLNADIRHWMIWKALNKMIKTVTCRHCFSLHYVLYVLTKRKRKTEREVGKTGDNYMARSVHEVARYTQT